MIYQDLKSGEWFEPRLDEFERVKMVKVKKPLTILSTKTSFVHYYDEDDETWKVVEIKDLKNRSVMRDIAYSVNPMRLDKTFYAY
jgi:hypothetical protein